MYTVTNKSHIIEVFNEQKDAESFINSRQLRHNYSIQNTVERITEDNYYFLLECLPPVFVSGFVFANPEPVSHFLRKNKFTPTYTGCFQKGGYYYRFTTTLEDIRNFHPSSVEI